MAGSDGAVWEVVRWRAREVRPSTLLLGAAACASVVGVLWRMKRHAESGGILPFAPRLSQRLRLQHILLADESQEEIKGKLPLLAARMHSEVYGCRDPDDTVGESVVKMTKVVKEGLGITYPYGQPRQFEQDGATMTAKVGDSTCFVMASSSYCGVCVRGEITDAAYKVMKKTGPNLGAVSAIGVNTAVQEVCDTVARYYRRRHGIVAASGFLACQNLVAHLVKGSPGRTFVFQDAKSHPCLRSGSYVADKCFNFKHNDPESARALLKKHRGGARTAMLIIESIYSTDGSMGNVPAFYQLSKEFVCVFIVDDAHGMGVLGDNSGGVEEHWGMRGCCDFICGTFSKSTSGQGGFICFDDDAHLHGFTCSDAVGFAANMNAFSAAYVTEALTYIMEKGAELATESKRLKQYMKERLHEKCGLEMSGANNSARVTSIKLRHPTQAVFVVECLVKRGFLASPFCFPACPYAISVIRLTIIPGVYTDEIIDRFAEALKESIEESKGMIAGFQHNAAIFTA